MLGAVHTGYFCHIYRVFYLEITWFLCVLQVTVTESWLAVLLEFNRCFHVNYSLSFERMLYILVFKPQLLHAIVAVIFTSRG